jgi:urease accessory protein UreF
MEAIRPDLNIARAEATLWLGDWHPLVRQIAPGEGIVASNFPSTPAQADPSQCLAALGRFLAEYKESVLLTFELPVVKQACEHTLRNEMKELVALDRSMDTAPWLEPYKQDSRTSGRLHLERLKPLRDQRGIRRYIAAVDEGEANGWHFLVAGAALGLYALPLRQGLMDYALHTFWNVVGQASAAGSIEPVDATDIVNHLASDLPEQIQRLVPSLKLASVS